MKLKTLFGSWVFWDINLESNRIYLYNSLEKKEIPKIGKFFSVLDFLRYGGWWKWIEKKKKINDIQKPF